MRPIALVLMAFLGGTSVCAAPVLDGMQDAQIILLGEVHDNPHHHAMQTEYVAQIRPRALVFEMLTEEQSSRVTDENRQDTVALERVLGWRDTGWPDFDLYYPIFAAAPQAQIYGAAVPREAARQAMKDGIATWFGPDSDAYGLSDPLPEEQQTAREAMQMQAHCNALPDVMLPIMVDLQRLRDAVLARAALKALDQTGGPVVVITGNGHARRDWGAPSYVALLQPMVRQFALGQTEEDDSPDPSFDAVLSAPSVTREDPCKAFK